MTHSDLKPHVDTKHISWDQVLDTLVNAHVPPEEIASFMGGEPIRSVHASVMLQQLVSSGEVPPRPVL